MKVTISGLPGAGKSYKLGQVAIELLYRNVKYHAKSGNQRILWSNMRFSEEVENEFQGYIKYWSDPAEIIRLRDCDLLIDEEAAYFDATQWQNMPLESKRFFQQHRRYGVDIYGACQDFAQVDKSIRRITSHLIHLTKLIGSRDISATKPNPRFIWGVVLVRELDPTVYDEQESKFQGAGLIPKFMWLSKGGVDVFNTREDIAVGLYPAMRHIMRKCEKHGHGCNFQKVIHI